jgi:uncharacterized membrane protein (DUF106 family)
MPLMTIEITAIAAVYALFVILLQRKLINIDRMYELRAKMNDKTTGLTNLIKSNAPKEEISQKQKELMDISTQSMKQQLKPLVVVFPLFLMLYYVALPHVFNMTSTLTLASFTISYSEFFVILLFVIGLIFSTSFSIYDRKRLSHKYNFGLMQPTFKPGQEQQ